MPKSLTCYVCGSLFKNKDHMIIVANDLECCFDENHLYINSDDRNYCEACLRRELRKRYNFKRGD
jgi:hypothetical protein